MPSQVEICNRALIRLGADTITSLTEDSKEGRLANAVYEQVRRDLLRSHPWNFAMKRVVLAALVTDPAFEYTYQYQLPSDCIRVWKLYDSNQTFKVEGGLLLTDESVVNLIYISDETNPELFDSLFVSLMVLKLAKELAFGITGQSSIVQVLEDEFNRLKREAKLFDGQESWPDDLDDGDWLGGRY